MAELSNSEAQAYALIDTLNTLVSEAKATIFEIASVKNKLTETLQEFPLDELKELKKALQDNNKEVTDSIDDAAKNKKKQLEAEQEYQKKVEELNEKIKLLNEELNSDSKFSKDILQRNKDEREQELKDLQDQHNEQMEGNKARYEEHQNLQKQQDEADKQAEEKYRKELADRRTKLIDVISSGVQKFSDEISQRFKNALDSVVNTYEQSAGKLSAALNQTTDYVSNLQHKIASELRDTSLRSAISNVAVLSEATSLASSGFTNTDKLLENATAIAEAKTIAPTLSLDNINIKALTNVFGSDFITKFASIQAAVQETAGSTAFLSQNLTKMMDDLAPVYQNAEYQVNALQSTADVQATISAAIDSGLINESQAQEYMSMITELMDPSKAFKSSSTAVKAAATIYDFGSGDPLQALQAILNARGQMYGGINMGNSYMGNVSRSLAASAYGDNTLNATYMQGGLYGLDIITTDNLGTVWSEQEGKLSSGKYTTQRTEIQNWLENSPITQAAATMSKYLPILYSVVGVGILRAIQTLPTKIATAIKTGGISSSGSIDIDSTGHSFGGSFMNQSVFGDLGSTTGGKIANRLTSGFNMTAYGIGAMGLMSHFGQFDSERSNLQNWGHGGNTLSAALSYGQVGLGAGTAIGSIFGPAGSLIGAGVGTLVGVLAGVITASEAQKETQEANTKAIEEQTKATKDLLGEGVSAISALDAKREIARGGGIVYSASGDAYKVASYTNNGFAFGLDYVPYDGYVAKLHKGESIVTASASERLRQQDPNFWNDSYNNSVVNALEKQTDSIVDALNGDVKYSPLTKAGPTQYIIKNNFA